MESQKNVGGESLDQYFVIDFSCWEKIGKKYNIYHKGLNM
jgi:hypothetical protein